jgi:branched-chain amino acid transport system ATP-binding protein
MRVITGLLKPKSGSVLIDGLDVTKLSPNARAKHGVCLIPEGRGIFRTLSVRENLDLLVPPWISDPDLGVAIEAFPILGKRMSQVAGSLSGGEQQMLALSRAFLSQPRIVLVDEVSMGLAPVLVDQIFESLEQLVASGCALLIVEQYVNRALALADYAYFLKQGDVALEGPSSDIDEEKLSAIYVG